MMTGQLAAALGYRKFRPDHSPRMLVLRADYYVYADVCDTARELGWQVEELPVASRGKGSSTFISELLIKLVEFKPDFALTINHLGFDEDGVLAGILHDLGIPLASWFVDHPLPILGGAEVNANSSTQVFCFERSALSWLSGIGFDDPRYLPTASNPSHFHPRAIDSDRARDLGEALVLVAGSWWAKAHSEFPGELREVARQLENQGLIEAEQLRIGALANRVGLDRRLYHAMQIALAESSMNRRREFVEALAPLDPLVIGDAHWKELVPGLRWKPSISPTRDLPALYRGSQVNLNISAAQMPTAVNQRVWDVPGAGGFLLTDAREGLDEHFEEGREVVTYEGPEDALAKALHYLGQPQERAAISERAFLRVEAEHRYHHRLRAIEEILRQRFGTPRVDARASGSAA